MHVQELARRLGAAADPALDFDVSGVAAMEEAGPSQVTFLSNPKYVKKLKETRAAGVLVATDFQGESPAPVLKIANPYLAFAHAIALFYSPPPAPPGVHPTAVLGQRVRLGKGVSVGAFSVLGDGVAVGDGTTIHPHCVVYAGATIGADCLLHSHVVVREHVRLGDRVIVQNGTVLGADGFGFAPKGDGSWHKIPQSGTVEIGDDVEVQALSAIDRATVGKTIIGRGTKIDNLVQIGHGCQVGEDTIVCGQVGLAGSSIIGNRVTLAGQVGVAGHLTIHDGANVTAQSGIMDEIPSGQTWSGYPAVPVNDYGRITVHYLHLPDLAKRLKAVEKALESHASAKPAP